MMYQKTIARPIVLEGIGLHTGKSTKVVFKPAPENTGIYFIRKDLRGQPALLAQSRNVRATQMATVIGGDSFAVSTVEHCMSAVSALQIDNMYIELEGHELPIGDGSAWIFLDALKQAEIIEQNALRTYLYITSPIYFSQGDKYAYALPYNGFKITSTIEFSHPAIGRQKLEMNVNPYTFEKEVAKARTFGFMKDVEYLKSKGLALGGSLENAVVMDEREVINPEGLRQPDEFIRHKVMDALGDLTMLGYPIVGHIVLHKAGHDLMHGFCQSIISAHDKYRLIELGQPLSKEAVFESVGLRPQYG